MPSTYQALPLPPSLTTLRPAMVPAYPEARSTPPKPLRLPWPLKPLGSASTNWPTGGCAAGYGTRCCTA